MIRAKFKFVLAAVALAALLGLACGCGASSSLPARGDVVSSDGVILAESQDAANGQGRRVYALGEAAAHVVGSCYAQDAPEGIEQAYADDLLRGDDVRLTLNARIQGAAFEALGGCTGAAVVVDPSTGAVLAMASTPPFDPASEAVPEDARANHATELHIPGSTFKTVTLAAALQSGQPSLDEAFPAPPELLFDGGEIRNYNSEYYGDLPLSQAYAKSVNTVFAQLGLRVGIDGLVEMSRAFGFDSPIIEDFPCGVSTVLAADEMDSLMQGWTGVGQALYQADGTLQGPMMTPLQGAVIAATVVNGGTLMKPFVVDSIGDMRKERPRAGEPVISAQVAVQLKDCMREVVESGTGTSAAVQGIDVGGKTGTAETRSGADDGWFIGFAQRDDERYALAVMVEDAQSSEAARIAGELVSAIF